MYGLVNEASVLAASPDRSTILSSRVNQSKGGRTQCFGVRAPFWNPLEIPDAAKLNEEKNKYLLLS